MHGELARSWIRLRPLHSAQMSLKRLCMSDTRGDTEKDAIWTQSLPKVYPKVAGDSITASEYIAGMVKNVRSLKRLEAVEKLKAMDKELARLQNETHSDSVASRAETPSRAAFRGDFDRLGQVRGLEAHDDDSVQPQSPCRDKFKRARPLKYDGITRSWTQGVLPRAGSQSPRVLRMHREMLVEFEQAVESDEIVQVGPYSPEKVYSPAGPRRQGAHAYQPHDLPNPLPERRGCPLKHAEQRSIFSGYNLGEPLVQCGKQKDIQGKLTKAVVSFISGQDHLIVDAGSQHNWEPLGDEDEEETDEEIQGKQGRSPALQASMHRVAQKTALHGQMQMIVDAILLLFLFGLYLYLFPLGQK